jgi:hypothetical protein
MAAKKPFSKAAASKKPAQKPAAKKPALKPVAKKTTAKPATKEAPAYKKRSAVQAAKDLQNYVAQKNADLGKKGKPSVFVKAAQQDMGGGLATDGIFGPKTKARAAALLGAKPAPEPQIAKAALLAPPEPAQAVKSVAAKSTQSTSVSTNTDSDEATDDMAAEPAPDYSASAAQMASTTSNMVSMAPSQMQVPTIVLPPQTQAQVSNMPEDVKAIVIEALNNFRDQITADKADYNALIAQLSEKFAPNLKAIADQVEVASLQRQATSEHNALVKSDDRWSQNARNQQAIVDKLAELVQSLRVTSGISKKVFEAYGVHI